MDGRTSGYLQIGQGRQTIKQSTRYTRQTIATQVPVDTGQVPQMTPLGCIYRI